MVMNELPMMGPRSFLELLLQILCNLSKSLTNNSIYRCSFITFKKYYQYFAVPLP